MKKILLSVAAIFAFGFANAQDTVKSESEYGFAKGNMYVEGSLSVKSDDDSNSFSFNPKFGYMITDQISIGGDLDIGSSKQDRIGALDPDKKSSNWGIGAFARYNFLELNNKRFVAYGEVGLGFSSTKVEEDYIDPIPDYDDTSNGIKANVDLGINYFITPRFAAVFVVANVISYNNENPEHGDSTNSFSMDINLFNNPFDQAQFGLLYKF
ncbi:MAG TPA: outer membrane beta-barrel protein [Flavobacterium sp.]|uniref:outer membrane beta-barrel protein n=1 Tax=Flavobacterium sp. TaxID=239 RepID=UPI002BF8897B|nr:outer membrane beta-barrel protein [Flavobacterium sp.]HSD13016.1 outer membrane beta-barrel protein [Flavobacterium sp.]